MVQRVLLDTHVVLWAMQEPARLGSQRELLGDPAVTRVVSAVVVWEVAIKVGLGRLRLPMPVAAWASRAVSDLAAERAPITDQHAAAVAELPHHHHDPFDRLLVAQARFLDVPLVTADPVLRAYDVEIIEIES